MNGDFLEGSSIPVPTEINGRLWLLKKTIHFFYISFHERLKV